MPANGPRKQCVNILQRFARFKATSPRSAATATQFAESIGIHPGMLQHAGIVPYSHLNGMQARFEWVD